jgi:hypothetical protein
MQHDIFGHPAGEVVDCHPHQRHVGQGAIRHQRIDAGAEVEDHLQIGKKRRQLAWNRLPHRGIMNFRWLEPRRGQQDNAPVATDRVEAPFPAVRRPVIGTAMDQQRQRALRDRHLFLFRIEN